MTKGRAALPLRISCVDGWKQQVPPLRFAPVGMTLRLGGHIRRFHATGEPAVPFLSHTARSMEAPPSLVIPTEAYPNFLPRLRPLLIWFVVCGWKASKNICQSASPGSIDSAPQAFRYAIDSRGASLRMTALWGGEKVTD